MTNDRPQGSVRYDNSDRVVIVTGGASGIGRAVCDAFSRSGAQVVCADIDQGGAEGLSEGVFFRKCDTSLEEDCRDTAVWVTQEYGRDRRAGQQRRDTAASVVSFHR